MLEIFEEAAHFTMDKGLRDILLNCSMGVLPPKWSMDDTTITVNGQSHTICSDPMDLCNLVHDIITTKTKKAVVPTSSSTRVRNGGFSLDELFLLSRREAERLGRDEEFADKVWGCIYSSVYLKVITPNDLVYEGGLLTSINNIDTSVPMYTRDH